MMEEFVMFKIFCLIIRKTNSCQPYVNELFCSLKDIFKDHYYNRNEFDVSIPLPRSRI